MADIPIFSMSGKIGLPSFSFIFRGILRHFSLLKKNLLSILKHLLFTMIFETEKAMAPYSSTLAWKIPWMQEPGGLQSMGSQRVRHDGMTSLYLFKQEVA